MLGYLLAGVALGPHGIRHVFSSDDAHEILEFSEFGIVLLLFLIVCTISNEPGPTQNCANGLLVMRSIKPDLFFLQNLVPGLPSTWQRAPPYRQKLYGFVAIS